MLKLSEGKSPTSLLSEYNLKELAKMHITPYYQQRSPMRLSKWEGWSGKSGEEHMFMFEGMIDVFKRNFYKWSYKFEVLNERL